MLHEQCSKIYENNLEHATYVHYSLDRGRLCEVYDFCVSHYQTTTYGFTFSPINYTIMVLRKLIIPSVTRQICCSAIIYSKTFEKYSLLPFGSGFMVVSPPC